MSELSNSIEGIELAHRDIRVSRRHAAWNLATAAGERARQLALSIGDRYTSRFLRRPQLNLVFFQAGESVFAPIQNNHTHIAQEQRHHTAFNLSPRIALTVINWPQQLAESSASSSGLSPAANGYPASVLDVYPAAPAAPAIKLRSIRSIWRQAGQLANSHTINAHRRTVRWQQQSRDEGQIEIVRRLTKRLRRIDGAENNPPHPASAVATARSIPRVLRRPAAEAAVEAQPAADQTTNPSRQAAWPQQAARVDDPAALDINRLTEQVVSTIDRRIIAHRERLGRM